MAQESPFQENALGSTGGWDLERQRKVPEYKNQILQLLASGLFASEIALQLGISQRTIRKWRDEDKVFAEDYRDAENSWVDQIEKEAVRRAKEGILEPVISKNGVVMVDDGNGGKEPLMQRKYSDGLMQFILKGRRREVFGDRTEVDGKLSLDVAGAKQSLADKFAAAAGEQS